jgi:hypothetical protein
LSLKTKYKWIIIYGGQKCKWGENLGKNRNRPSFRSQFWEILHIRELISRRAKKFSKCPIFEFLSQYEGKSERLFLMRRQQTGVIYPPASL